MSNQKFPKIELAIFIAFLTALFYLWGWVYWTHYYHTIGLPLTYMSFGVERIMLGGVYFFDEFFRKYIIYGLITILVLMFVTELKSLKRRKENIFLKLLEIRYRGLIITIILIAMFSFIFNFSMRYIRADAEVDSNFYRHERSKCFVKTFSDSVFAFSERDTLRLIDMKENKVILLDKDNTILIIPEKEIRFVRVFE